MSKRRSFGDSGKPNSVHIGDAIQDLLKTYRIKARFDEANLIQSWERLVGKPVAKRTKKVFIRSKVLYVELDSPGMKQDLTLHKSQIIALFIKEFGTDIIKDLVIL
jgi:predicted nucleic acid-binding Zn ribbon protein